MSYEIDFMAVGDGDSSGDAIAARWGNLAGPRGQQTVMIIDGGTKTSGEALVKHVKKYYDTDIVDFVVCTHPDIDHASGLTVVLEGLSFGILLMHRPWEHASDIKKLFENQISSNALEEKLRKALEAAHTLEEIAQRKGRPVVEPFAGMHSQDGSLLFLGPSKPYYESLIPQFRQTPAAKTPVLRHALSLAKEAIAYVFETLDLETLRDPVGPDENTSAENNSSVITLLTSDDSRILFTGDAGFDALIAAAGFAEGQKIDLSKLKFLQVPHHGSRRNIGPTVLNRIKAQTAFVSVGPKCEPKHPSKKVTNALKRRGANVFATKGVNIWHSGGQANPRSDYTSITPLPFYSQVEE